MYSGYCTQPWTQKNSTTDFPTPNTNERQVFCLCNPSARIFFYISKKNMWKSINSVQILKNLLDENQRALDLSVCANALEPDMFATLSKCQYLSVLKLSQNAVLENV